MTELFIDGVSVVLPKDFSVQVKRENSFVTKNGEYTYDITLPLTNRVNAELYKHLNRLNSIQEIVEKRSAVLMADNRVYCNGIEVITGWTDETVSLQIASGNSELNYFIGGDLQISFLKMRKTVPGFDGDTVSGSPDYLKYIQKSYPDVDYCLAPVKDDATGEIHNKWCMDSRAGISSTGNPATDDFFYVTPQPYLMCYIEDLIRVLGYSLEYNQLTDTIFKNLYICHTECTDEWCKMLPGWSVSDFFSEIEKLFNVTFLVDNRYRTVRIALNASFFAGCQSAHVRQVTDVYEVEKDEDNDVDDPVVSNVKYKFDDCDFWRWASLSEAVKNKALYDTIPEDFEGSDGRAPRIAAWFSMSSHKRTDTIYKDEKDGREYMSLVAGGESNTLSYTMVNHFAGLEREDATNTVELEIVPAAYTTVEINSYGVRETTVYRYYLPVIIGADKTDTTQETLIEMILNNSSQPSESKKTISLAFYTKMSYLVVNSGVQMMYPVPYVDEYTLNLISDRSQTLYKTNAEGASLRFVTLDKLLYQGGYDIDYTKGVKIETHDPNVYDTRSVFEIRNKRYICKEMEFTLDISGRKGAWTGTFYPIHISDTEADARWILTDGKWRDGGVWLDNGRWLDD